MKNVPTKSGEKWLPSLEGDQPGEKDEIWTDQTLCDTEKQAWLHGQAMLNAYEAGKKFERNRIKAFLDKPQEATTS